MLLTRFCFTVLSLVGLLAPLVLSASALASPNGHHVVGPGPPNQAVHSYPPVYAPGPGPPNQAVHLQWPDVPGSVGPGVGAIYQISTWGSNPRTITFSHPAHVDDIVVQWAYDPRITLHRTKRQR